MSSQRGSTNQEQIREAHHKVNGWYFLASPAGKAAVNMAIDEALLLKVRLLDRPVLRFYSWAEPAATFGYFQKHADVEQTTALRPLVRRPTGGGVVPHEADWTYSVAIPPSHEWYAIKAVESYHRIHAWICAAFEACSIQTELAPYCSRTAPGQCFVGFEQHDLLWRGRKIAGAAQRRSKHGLLIQGSVQPGKTEWSRAQWEQSMRVVATQRWFAQWNPFGAGSDFQQFASELAAAKYSQDAFNRIR